MLSIRRLGQLAARRVTGRALNSRLAGFCAGAESFGSRSPSFAAQNGLRFVHHKSSKAKESVAATWQHAISKDSKATDPDTTQKSKNTSLSRKRPVVNPLLCGLQEFLLDQADPEQVASVRSELKQFREILIKRSMEIYAPCAISSSAASRSAPAPATDTTTATATATATATGIRNVRPAFLTQELDRAMQQMIRDGAFERLQLFCVLAHEVFPQMTYNLRQQNVLMQHLSLAMNHTNHFDDLLRLIVHKHHQDLEPELDQVDHSAPLQPKLFVYYRNALVVQSLLVACSHRKDARTALRIFERVQTSGFNLRKLDYFHVLLSCLNDQSRFFESRQTQVNVVLALCDEYLALFPGEQLQLSLMAPLLMLVLEHDETQLDRAMRFFDDMELSRVPKASEPVEFTMEILLQKLWARGRGESSRTEPFPVSNDQQPALAGPTRNAMYQHKALAILHKSMSSFTFSRAWKERVSRYLLHQALLSRASCSMEQVQQIMQNMQELDIGAKIETIGVFLNRVFDEKYVSTIEEMDFLLQQFPQVIRLNSLTLSEAFFALHRRQEQHLMTQLMVYALNKNIFIKSQVLDALVGNYYKHGDLHSTCAVVDALRKNPFISISEDLAGTGIKANAALGRIDVVAALFEQVFCHQDQVDMNRLNRMKRSRLAVMQLAQDAFDKLGNDDLVGQLDFLIRREHRRSTNWWNHRQETDEVQDMKHATSAEAEPSVSSSRSDAKE